MGRLISNNKQLAAPTVLGQLALEMRRNRNLTLKETCPFLNVGQSQLTRLENGNSLFTFEQFKMLAEHLGYEVHLKIMDKR